jgi:hypothetical protein
MALYNSWTDDSALWQVKNGQPGTAQALAAWDYIESRLQGCDQVLANARVDETGDQSCDTCGANLTDGSGDGVNGHWQNCTKADR